MYPTDIPQPPFPQSPSASQFVRKLIYYQDQGQGQQQSILTRAKSFNLFMEYGGRTSKWEEGAPTPELLGVFIHQSGGNLGEERGVANMVILEINLGRLEICVVPSMLPTPYFIQII